MFVNHRKYSIFFRQSFLRIWRAAEQPPAAGSDAGWSLDMSKTILDCPRGICTIMWHITGFRMMNLLSGRPRDRSKPDSRSTRKAEKTWNFGFSHGNGMPWYLGIPAD